MNPFRNAYLQELSANQKKIDKNKNNKIDGEDLAHLRKEEKDEEVCEDCGKSPCECDKEDEMKEGYEGKGNHRPGWMLRADPSLKQKIKDAQAKLKAKKAAKEVKEENELEEEGLKDACWKGYTAVGMKMKNGKKVPNCVPVKEEAEEIDERSMSDSEMKKREDIVKGMKKNVAGFKSRYGSRAKEVMYTTATKNAMKEEVLDEANHREFASQGKMHPDMAKHMKTGEHMDYYEPKTGDKVHGKVMKNDGKEVHVQQTHDSYDPKKKGSVHKFKVSTKLDEKKEDPPFDGPYTKVKDTVTDKSGAKHTPMSRAKHLAQQAAIAIAKKKVKEEFDMDITTEQALELLEAVKKQDIPAFLRKARGDKPLNLDDLKKNDSISDKNNLAKARGVKEEVEELDELSKTTIGSYVKKAKSSLIGSSQVMGMGSKTTGQKTHDKAEKKVQKRASGINKAVDRLTKEETEMNSFKSYMQEDLDEAMWPGTPEYKKKFGDAPSRGKVGTSSTTSKGTQTVTSTGVKHERDYEKAEKETSQPESGEKRGRGRPKGAASGARQKGSAAKADDRYDSTGFKLHLPNKNR